LWYGWSGRGACGSGITITWPRASHAARLAAEWYPPSASAAAIGASVTASAWSSSGTNWPWSSRSAVTSAAVISSLPGASGCGAFTPASIAWGL